jgi:hypothetical protein
MNFGQILPAKAIMRLNAKKVPRGHHASVPPLHRARVALAWLGAAMDAWCAAMQSQDEDTGVLPRRRAAVGPLRRGCPPTCSAGVLAGDETA